jgi:aminoglycoside phosphotransferase
MLKLKKKHNILMEACPIDVLLEQVLAQWRRAVASSEAKDLLIWAMHAVWYWRTARAF